ncbi:MAG: hypothetical protein U5K37_12060 [Natrialbaceae archaeon]|nr:hypothetical protein [Natrialbaceae archaeon]
MNGIVPIRIYAEDDIIRAIRCDRALDRRIGGRRLARVDREGAGGAGSTPGDREQCGDESDYDEARERCSL